MIRLVAAIALSASTALANPVHEAMQDYADFATYDAGIILPEQLSAEIFAAVTFIDTRSAEAYAEATIPGARNIEWREIFARLDEVPQTGKVVLFCNTGALSAQAAFGLRVLGRDNVLILQTGYLGWLETAAYHPES
ncbi:rhodanese-like domain-containing protein [Pseudaestuariivita atlantica]|uniref:Sulfurtransferase n=1 Tax=Pseudaestuariivita atlantica TaxID=1317121 RepID=A0A0L1JM42_9RHOB|nr:rhodanese-like domain-containing protein [Pseudaestuariivita atlantica]KNG92825.1 sulfurtransferase [Pseudaestuariivita atlantica]